MDELRETMDEELREMNKEPADIVLKRLADEQEWLSPMTEEEKKIWNLFDRA